MNHKERGDAFAALMRTRLAYDPAKQRAWCEQHSDSIVGWKHSTAAPDVCAQCGRSFGLLQTPIRLGADTMFKEKPFDGGAAAYVRQLADAFTKMGYPAELATVCGECLPYGRSAAHGDLRFTVRMDDTGQSQVVSASAGSARFISDIRLALAFLQGASSYAELARRTCSVPDTYEVDNAIRRVLGIRPTASVLSASRMNRREIVDALDALCASRQGKDWFPKPAVDFSTCYCIILYQQTYAELTCETCGARERFETKSNVPKPHRRREHTAEPRPLPPSDIIARYERLCQAFTDRGYDARLICRCNACVAEAKERGDALPPHRLLFSFRAPGMRKPSVTALDEDRYSDHWYRMALEVLDGMQTFRALMPHEDFENTFWQNMAFRKIQRVMGVYSPRLGWKIQPRPPREED